MHTDTKNYVHLQTLYKNRANEEKAQFKAILQKLIQDKGVVNVPPDAMIDDFVKNAHGLKLSRGKKWKSEINQSLANEIEAYPAAVAVHLALSALAAFQATNNRAPEHESATDLIELQKWIKALLTAAGYTLGEPTEEKGDFPTELEWAMKEVMRTPTADLPTTAAFLGGLVAQETIKMITKQYIPFTGHCVIDMIASTTVTIHL
jgi:amyloid beta precursor protein binding protein 1